MITIAIAKGRMQDSALSLLARAGIRLSDEAVNSRRLALTDETGQYRFIFVKPADVPVYVEHGIADCGVVGRDVLLESGEDLLLPLGLGIGRCRIVVSGVLLEAEADLLLPLDLGIARCRIVVAGRDAEGMTNVQGMIRVATKYAQIARAHFGARGIPVEIIQLSGSVELAPALGLADMIVDLVETGVTLRENGLTVVEEIAESTGRLVVNRASYQLKTEEVGRLVEVLEGVVTL